MVGKKALIIKIPFSSSSASTIRRANQVAAMEGLRAEPDTPSATAQVAPSSITSHFSQSQLALALAIQKGKPEALSTNEYCQQLRKSIKTGQPLSIDGLRYIDTCEFWKDQYTKIHLENRALQCKILALEQKVQQSTSVSFEKTHDQANHSEGRMEGGDLPVEPPENIGRQDIETSRKRPAQFEEHGAGYHEQGYVAFSSSDDICLSLSNYVFAIKHQRKNLEKASRSSSTLDDVNIIAKSIIQTLTLLESNLSNTCLPLKLLTIDNQDYRTSLLIQQVMYQITFSFLSCFEAMNELCATIPGRAKMPEVVYRMVMFCNKALNLRRSLGNLQAQFEVDQDAQRPRQKRSRVEPREYTVTKYLANCLVSLLDGIEWKVGRPGHADLLEGMLFCVLEEAGRLVSEAVFAEHVATSDNPGNISKTNDPMLQKSINHESRYLVQILQAAVGGTKKRALIAQVLAQGNPDSNEQRRLAGSAMSLALSGDLLSKTRKLLQSTLVRSAVGESNLETLRLPTPPLEETDMPLETNGQIEKYGSEWLVQSVWGIIGWDLIA
ncbi:hypothetical protein V8E51_006839 [Hyaloscypha variabilis]